MLDLFDVIIIGGGIAGASVASRLSSGKKMLLLEMEDRPGYHSSGRSAAIFVPDQGLPTVKALVAASYDFLTNPPSGFVEGDILSPRGMIFLAQSGDEQKLQDILENAPDFKYLGQDELYSMIPGLAAGKFLAAAYSASTKDIDVDKLHQGYLRLFKANSGTVKCRSEVISISKTNEIWTIRTRNDEFKTKKIINAAGAWGDRVGKMAGCEPLGLTPKKRTAAIVQFDKPADPNWPMVGLVQDNWYFQPEGSYYFISPADEIPTEPCDAWADDMDVATIVDTISHVIDANVISVESSWAGLRSFTPDNIITIGYDTKVEGFFWLIGQGGCGIETSPAVSLLAACVFEDKPIPEHLVHHGVDVNKHLPDRFKKG